MIDDDIKGLEQFGFKVSDTPEGLAEQTQEGNEQPPVEAQPEDTKNSSLTNDAENAQPEPQPEAQEATPEPQAEGSGKAPEAEQPAQTESFGEIVDLEGSSESGDSARSNDSPQENFLDSFNEKYETSFESEDAIREALNGNQSSDISEHAMQLDAFLKAYPDFTILDYVQTQLIDYSKISDSELVIQSLMEEGYSREAAADIFDDEYTKSQVDTDMMEESEIALAERKNRLIDHKLAKRANEYRDKMTTLREKYKAPEGGYKPATSETQQEQGLSDAEKDAWSSAMKDTLGQLETMTFEVADGKAFKFSAKDFVAQNSDKLSNMEDALGMFLKEDGETWDTQKFAEALVVQSALPQLVKSIYANAFGAGKASLANEGKNLNYNQQGKRPPITPDRQAAVQKTMQQLASLGGNDIMSIK